MLRSVHIRDPKAPSVYEPWCKPLQPVLDVPLSNQPPPAPNQPPLSSAAACPQLPDQALQAQAAKLPFRHRCHQPVNQPAADHELPACPRHGRMQPSTRAAPPYRSGSTKPPCRHHHPFPGPRPLLGSTPFSRSRQSPACQTMTRRRRRAASSAARAWACRARTAAAVSRGSLRAAARRAAWATAHETESALEQSLLPYPYPAQPMHSMLKSLVCTSVRPEQSLVCRFPPTSTHRCCPAAGAPCTSGSPRGTATHR